MKTMKFVILFGLSFFWLQSHSQNAIVAVDGFFVQISKDEAIKYLGQDNIKDTTFISSDSARTFLGKYGKNGLFVIETKVPCSQLSRTLKFSKKYFASAKPRVYINGVEKIRDFDMKTIDPKTIESIDIVSPLSAIKEKGMDYVGGIINITLKKK